ATDGLRSGLAIGGTAVGTGINTHPDFAGRVCHQLQRRVGGSWDQAPNHPEAQATRDTFLFAHACVRIAAVSLTRIANDIRLLASGPRCGIGEVILPAIQPGSSIMPGKSNPVLCESLIQVSCRVIGNDTAIATAGLGGVGSLLELNVAMPVMIDAFLESTNLLANAVNVFVEKVLQGLQVNQRRCAEFLEQSLMNVTALVPAIGYDRAAEVARRAHLEQKTIRQVAREMKLLDDATLDSLLDPQRMTRPLPPGG
ncbi:MAG: lyase family protein, partial [Phycisphaerae bacterium]|nr:lyase family protein [Phycisphaerae bacterium]